MMIVENQPSSDLALAERTAQVDRLVLEQIHDLPNPGCAILAVGGYGRRHLFPHSDIDILLLFDSDRLALATKDVISQFLRQLWDARLRVSHSVRTPSECLEVHDQNTELNISVLDHRYLAGDRALYADLARRLPRFLQGNRESLVRNLSQLTRERHKKYADTFYHLEPNVKETPGGLRDYQLLCWLQQLRGSAPELSPELHEAFRHFSRLRTWLHRKAGRDQNVLNFDAQDAIADEWQEGDAAHWMRGYYRHARTVYRAAARELEAQEAQNSSLFAQFRDRRSRLSNADFAVHRDRVAFRTPQRMDVEPEFTLGLFEFVARHGVRPSAEAEQQVEARLGKLRAWFTTPRPLWATLSQILSLPHAPLALRSMHDTGILMAIFPELEQIECLVIRDFYHRYTVDEHTLVAIQNLWDAGEPYRSLLAEVKDSAILAFALLFHDAGKGTPGEGHVDASMRVVRPAMMRVQMPAHETETVLFLIGRHLELSAAMQSRDLFDPQTIKDVAQQVETVEWLKALTLLTYADISAVNPTAMTPWRAEQLWQLYLKVYNQLTRALESERIDAGASDFLRGFPVRYLRTHAQEEIDHHIELEAQSRKRGVAVDVRRLDTAWQLTLVAADRPGLFASAAGTLSSFGMNILKAEAFANRVGLVLDTFTFTDPNRTLDQNPSEIDRLRAVAERVVTGKADVKELLRNRRKAALPSRKAGIEARISFDSDASQTSTLIEIVAEDRPGLLYDLASAISSNGGNIEVVLIDTQAHKAFDVFYVTAGGKKLSPQQQDLMAEALGNAAGQA